MFSDNEEQTENLKNTIYNTLDSYTQEQLGESPIDIEICPGKGYKCRLAQLMAYFNPLFEEVTKGKDQPDFKIIWK